MLRDLDHPLDGESGAFSWHDLTPALRRSAAATFVTMKAAAGMRFNLQESRGLGSIKTNDTAYRWIDGAAMKAMGSDKQNFRLTLSINDKRRDKVFFCKKVLNALPPIAWFAVPLAASCSTKVEGESEGREIGTVPSQDFFSKFS